MLSSSRALITVIIVNLNHKSGRERERKEKKRLTAFFTVHFDFPAVVNQICVQC